MAYLIHVIGLSRETAKALIIDSAIGWQDQVEQSQFVGYGVVPRHIEDIVQSKEDEIRFIISGVSEKYFTYTYNLPVPVAKEKHPFIARATLCYFPNCSRNQGVDYTNTEMDLHFGRVDAKGKIKSIDQNRQGDDDVYHLFEEQARKLYRKWDNVKSVREVFTGRQSPRKVYNGFWGISVTTKERLDSRDGQGQKFGVVVTLKEINGINRIEEFIQQCSLRGWLVNKIDITNRIDIYNIAEEEIVFED